MQEQELKLANNSKTKFSKNHKNTIGFMYGKPEDGGTCPNATEGEGGCLNLKRTGGVTKTCYMDKLCKAYPNLKKALVYNTTIVKDKTYEELLVLLYATIQKFWLSCESPDEWYFRINYSGDFEKPERAKAWATAVKSFPQITFWVYTRDHWAAKYFKDINNITFYFSIDPQNKNCGYEEYEPYKNEKNMALAYMGEITEDIGYKFIKCPETYKLKQNTDTAGACASCGLCWRKSRANKARNISFKLH